MKFSPLLIDYILSRYTKRDNSANKILNILKKNFTKIESNNHVKTDFNHILGRIYNKIPISQHVSKERATTSDRHEIDLESISIHNGQNQINKFRINDLNNSSITTNFFEEASRKNANTESSFFEEDSSNKSKIEINIVNQNFQNTPNKIRGPSPLGTKILKPPRQKGNITISESVNQINKKIDGETFHSQFNLKKYIRPSSPAPFRLSTLPRDKNDFTKKVDLKINNTINLIINNNNQKHENIMSFAKNIENFSNSNNDNKKEFFDDSSSSLERMVPKPPNTIKQPSDQNFRNKFLPSKPSKPVLENTKERPFVRKLYINQGREHSTPSPDLLSRSVLHDNMNKSVQESNHSDNILFQKTRKDKIINALTSNHNRQHDEEKGLRVVKKGSSSKERNRNEGNNGKLLEILRKEENMIRVVKPKNSNDSFNIGGGGMNNTNGKKPKMFDQY